MNGVPATLVYTVAVSPSTLARNDELAGRGDPDIVGLLLDTVVDGLLLDTVVDGFWVAVDPAVGLTYDEVWSAGTVSVWTLYDCPVVEFTAVIAFFIVDSNCDPIPGNLETISLWREAPVPFIPLVILDLNESPIEGNRALNAILNLSTMVGFSLFIEVRQSAPIPGITTAIDPAKADAIPPSPAIYAPNDCPIDGNIALKAFTIVGVRLPNDTPIAGANAFIHWFASARQSLEFHVVVISVASFWKFIRPEPGRSDGWGVTSCDPGVGVGCGVTNWLPCAGVG
jgi:hypothetical protein